MLRVMEGEVKKALTGVLGRVSAAAKARNPVSVTKRCHGCRVTVLKGVTVTDNG